MPQVLDALPIQKELDGIDAHLGALALLSTGELAVLRLLARGASNSGIAAELFLSDRTVESHIGAIFIKLGLPPRPEVNRRVVAALIWISAVD